MNEGIKESSSFRERRVQARPMLTDPKTITYPEFYDPNPMGTC